MQKIITFIHFFLGGEGGVPKKGSKPMYTSNSSSEWIIALFRDCFNLDFPPVEGFPSNPIQAVCCQTKHLPIPLFKVQY